MRNLFDQYKHPENRLTHALLTSLNKDRDLLAKFIEWATGKPSPSKPAVLGVIEQSFPDEVELQEAEEFEKGGLPDGCIYDDNGWALLIESKIIASLTSDQLIRHRQSAKWHELTNVDLLALVVNKPAHALSEDAVVKRWTELYQWLKKHKSKTEWPRELVAYMETLEAKLLSDGYLKEGALTVFTGIPFGNDHPYNYSDAKRLIRLAMDDLRTHSELRKELGADLKRSGRTAIKGKGAAGVWDLFWLENATDGDSFTKAPHLNLSIMNDRIEAMVIVPDKMRATFRRRLLDGGWENFQDVFAEVLDCFNANFKAVEWAVPWVTVLQRHFPHRGADPIDDARMSFDLRTAFSGAKSVKPQRQWLRVAFEALQEKKSNIEFDVGVIFHYEQCAEVINKPEILNLIANAWLACKPLIRKMIP